VFKGSSSKIIFVLFVCFVVSTFLSAQDQQPPPFRAGTTLIHVDVYPRQNGRVVEGLTAGDFQVLEDGVPQNVSAFEFIRAEPNPPDSERRDPRSQRESEEQAADPHNRVFVVYLDIYHTSLRAAEETRGPLLDFLNRTIGANDLFGVLTPETPVRQLTFARRTDTLQGELMQVTDWALRGFGITPIGRPAIEEQLETCMTGAAPLLGDALVALHREDTMMTSLEELMVRLRVLRDERKNILFISEGWRPSLPSSVIQALAKPRIPTIGPGRGGTLTLDPQRGMGPGQGQTWCNQQILRLGGIDFEARFRNLLTQANRANVSFYPVDAGGLQTQQAPAMPSQRIVVMTEGDRAVAPIIARHRAPNVQTLQELAENTDGIAIVNTNDIRAGFRKIADDLSAYYLLGYSSTNPAPDGKYRRIEVRLKQPNVNITARRGYMASTVEANNAAAAAAAAKAVPAPIAEELARLSRLRSDAELFSYGGARNGRLHVAVELSGQEMARGRWTNGADVEVTATGSAGGEVSGRARVEAGARGAVVELVLPPGSVGPWRTTLRVSQGTAALTDRLEIPARDSTPLVAAPILFRGAPAPRAPMRPVADFQFRRNERLRVEWPVADVLDSRTARLLDRRGAPLPIPAAVTEVDGPSGRVVNVDVNLAPLAEGDYLVELTAGKGGQTEKGLLAFRVVR
jgi:VWFA-related protein